MASSGRVIPAVPGFDRLAMNGVISSRVLVRCRAEVGEGPVYDPVSSMLFWVDIPRGRLWRWNRRNGSASYRDVGEPLGSVALIDGGGILLAGRSGISVLPSWNGVRSPWRPVEAGLSTQFNDGKCDPDGRFVAGTVPLDPRATGTLYRVDHDGTAHPLIDGVRMSNGLDWSPDGAYFYHVDTLTGTVSRYRWDTATGIPSDPIPFIEIPSSEGLPDGLCVDCEGCLWLAVWGSGEVRRYGVNGALLGVVQVATPNVSSCTFGGPQMNELYITTASQAALPDTQEADHAGNVFVATTSVKGQRPGRFPRHAIPSELLRSRTSSSTSCDAQAGGSRFPPSGDHPNPTR